MVTCQHAHVYALMNPAVRLKDEQPRILNKVILESGQEIVILQHLLTLLKLHLRSMATVLDTLASILTNNDIGAQTPQACKHFTKFNADNQLMPLSVPMLSN